MEITKERLTDILRTLIEVEAEAADPDYLREVLEDDCGMTMEEAKTIGVEWALEDDEDN